MKGKVLFGAGIAAGYVLGSRSGREAYEKLKARASALWESQPVQDKVTAATEAVKEKAPEVSEQLGEAARRAGTVIGSAVRRDNTPTGTAGVGKPDDAAAGIPAHSTHPETVNLGTSSASAASAAADVESDPALNDQYGQDWSDEGGATPAGAATNVDPDKVS
ncbi:YtxH domain-containing protein [Arthrobacter sp. UYEF36]|uniref:YtxH domain-containing protein n=1 Tax=Arthrobacter sp. UYEF36 TaxID=1756366 RepID=UPI003396A81C